MPEQKTDFDIFDDNSRVTQALQEATAPPRAKSQTEGQGSASVPVVEDTRPEPEVEITAPKSTPKRKTPPKKAVDARKRAESPVTTIPDDDISFPPNVLFRARIPQESKTGWMQLKSNMSAVLSRSLDDANLLRPLMEIIITEYEQDILEAATDAAQDFPKRPANNKPMEMLEFDNAIKEIYQKALSARKRKRA